MAIYEDFYVINSTSYIAEVRQTLCTEFIKELKKILNKLRKTYRNKLWH